MSVCSGPLVLPHCAAGAQAKVDRVWTRCGAGARRGVGVICWGCGVWHRSEVTHILTFIENTDKAGDC